MFIFVFFVIIFFIKRLYIKEKSYDNDNEYQKTDIWLILHLCSVYQVE